MEIKDKELHRISITAIIYNDEGKYLVTQRSLQKESFPGKWTVPGGGLEVVIIWIQNRTKMANGITLSQTHCEGKSKKK